MHIAIYSVLNVGYGGGFERWIGEVAPRLRSRGHQITIITTKAGIRRNITAREKLLQAGIDVFEVDNYVRPFTVPKLSAIREIAKLVKGVDILYFNNAFALNELLICSIKKILKIRIISGMRGIFPEVGSLSRKLYYRTVNRIVSGQFDAHHTLNRERETLLKSWGYRNVYRIPNGVDTSKFLPNKKGEIFTVTFVGRLTYEKGFDLFATCIKSLDKIQKNEMKFLVIGGGPLSRLAKELEERFSNVRYAGYVVEDELLIKAYQSSHVLVAPSRYEEFLLTALEAQACGTPVICSNIPGPRETVLNKKTGLLVKPSALELLTAILFFKKLWYESRDHYYEYSKNARRNALNYHWEIIVKKLEDMLTQVYKL